MWPSKKTGVAFLINKPNFDSNLTSELLIDDCPV